MSSDSVRTASAQVPTAPGIGGQLAAASPVVPSRHGSAATKALQRFARHRLAVAGLIIVIVAVIIAALLPLLTLSPEAVDLRAVRQPPSAAHPLGTDLIGRDVLSRVVNGARTSLAVGILAVCLYVVIGTLLGALAGYFGGWLDHVVMRLVDIVLSVPLLLMVIVFVSVVGPGLLSVITVIGLLGWPGTARLVRGQLLSLRQEEFIVAARVVGASASRIVLQHLLPNALAPLTVLATFGVASAILLEASLSFLGLGVRPPTPSWGNILNDAQSPTVLSDMPWLWLSPGLAIAISVLAVNFIGDGIRDAVDPRSNLQ
jgi:peptide/nickel transport system permease protein